MKKGKYGFLSGLIVFVMLFNLIDGIAFKESWEFLKAYAAAKDYAVGFKWDISELVLDGNANGEGDNKRTIELSDDGSVLKLTEMADENPILKSTFSFNLKRGIDAGNLVFTITGLDALIRDGTLTMAMNDPNLVKTWDISKVEGEDKYQFVNKVRVTSNNETTFTWQFNSRNAVNLSDIELQTSCTVTEVEVIDNGEGQEPTINEIEVPLTPNSLRFQYESVHDENDVKIICQKLEDLDANNLNTDYDWRSYYSVLGLKGLEEYEKDPSKYSLEEAVFTTSDEDAHYIRQNPAVQSENRNARSIRKADYFIQVDIPTGLTRDYIMVVNRSGEHIPLAEHEITVNGVTQTLYGFYDFQGEEEFNPKAGESYYCTYRVGVLNDKIKSEDLNIKLTGHFLVTYNDEPTVIDITDSASHTLSQDDEPVIGTGNWIDKHNRYELADSNGHTYGGVYYYDHAKHYNPQYQLLYDTIFNGKVVTYHLDASTNQAKINNVAQVYDLIFEDGRPTIQNLNGDSTSYRILDFDEYDFVRVKVEKLVDGNTVDGNEENLHGFDFDLYGRTEEGTFSKIGNGNTLTPTEIFLPDGIDEIKIVIRDLNIRTYVDVSVDIRYNVHETDYENIYIDTLDDHDFEYQQVLNQDGTPKLENGEPVMRKVRKETTNVGTRLVNTFNRKQYVGNYDIAQYQNYNTNNSYHLSDSAHSNTWLRDSTTVIDSSAHVPSDYYSTTITAGGTVQSDTEKRFKSFCGLF